MEWEQERCVRVDHSRSRFIPVFASLNNKLPPRPQKHDIQIQLGHVLLASVVDAKTASEGRLAVYVGHLPVFDSIARDISIREPRSRQLALVGQDLIGHTRIVLSCRSKRLYFAPLEANDIWAGQVV